MKKLEKTLNVILLLIASICIVSCEDIGFDKAIVIDGPPLIVKDKLPLSSVYSFNWETISWMPTPPGQSQIPVPWIGQGSLAHYMGWM